MDTTLKLQLDVKNNAQELRNYMLDLSNWEEEMKRKEIALNDEKPDDKIFPPPRNKIKKTSSENVGKVKNKPKKISGYDYSAWDKFDVEKACAEIDEEEDEIESQSSRTEQIIQDKDERKDDEDDSNYSNDKNISLIDEAFYEKEMGNNFVKKEQWSDAIKCYTNAINLDSKNAIYYANRSLCFLKLKNFKFAETDATTAIQLDKSYVKAYQRRAFARVALGQLAEAKADYEEILKFEPKNSLARLEINKIDEKLSKGQFITKGVEKKTFNPKNMFKRDSVKNENDQSSNCSKKQVVSSNVSDSSTNQLASFKTDHVPKNKISSETVPRNSKHDEALDQGTVINKKNNKTFEKGDSVEVVETPTNQSKLGGFRPLPDWCKVFHPVNIPPHKRSKRPFKKIDIQLVEKDEDFGTVIEDNKICESAPEKNEEKIIIKSYEDEKLNNEILSSNIPKTAIQFLNCWKVLRKDHEKCYSYLKKISGKNLPLIFENFLESNFFSEIVSFFANDEVKKEPEVIYDYLLGLSNVKRFSSLILFMSDTDRKYVKKCILELEKVKSKEEVLELYKLYELQN